MSNVEFTPVDCGRADEIPPEAPEGAWEARAKVKKASTKEGYPRLIVEWKTTLALTEENESFAGCRATTFLDLVPKGHKREGQTKRSLNQMCKGLGIALPDLSSLSEGSWDSLEPFIAAVEEGVWPIWTRHSPNKATGEVFVNVDFTAPKVRL
jgi:hypothetical protein